MLFNFKYRKDFNPDKTISENDVAISMKFFQYLRSDDSFLNNLKKESLVYKNIKNIKKYLKSDNICNVTLFMVTNEANGFSYDANETVKTFSENNEIEIKSVSLNDIISFIDLRKEKITARMIFSSNDFVSYKSDEKATSISYICKLSLLDLIRITCDSKNLRETFNWENIDDKQFENVKLLQSVLYDNIRGYLGDTNFNKNITNTIQNSPENFFMFNNGLTITSENILCKKFNLADKHTIELNDFQIVNGGQTLRSAYNYLLYSEEENRIKKLKISKVLVRIFKIENETDPTKNYISEFTNSQNTISDVDLKSVNQIQIDIERYLKDFNILYVRKKGDVGDINKEYKRRISMELFTQILYSSQGYPQRVSNAKNKLFSEYYLDIYSDENFKIEESKELVDLYYNIYEYYEKNNIKIINQKIFYVVYIIKKFNEDIEIANNYLEQILKKYDPYNKSTRKLLSLSFKDVIDNSIDNYKKEDLNITFDAYIKRMPPIELKGVQAYQLTSNKDAPVVQLSDEDIFEEFPLTYDMVINRCKSEINFFKKNKRFNEVMKRLKENKSLAYTRKLNPKNNKSNKTVIYSENIINEIKKELEKD